MRIIRGILKSRRFAPPKGFPSRPTTDFAKEGLFNMLENRLDLQDLRILDLCAGTGNISLEFASRESGHITAVDKHFKCVQFIQNMVKENKLEAAIRVFKADVSDYLKRCNEQFDLIFADPPYDAQFHKEMLEIIRNRALLKPGGLCIIEHGRQTDLNAEVGFEQIRKFGNVSFSFFVFES